MPYRLRKIVAAIAVYGVDCEKPRRGSHYKLRRGAEMYPIPAHNGLKSEIPDVYVKGLCRAFELDVARFVDELRKRATPGGASLEDSVDVGNADSELEGATPNPEDCDKSEDTIFTTDD